MERLILILLSVQAVTWAFPAMTPVDDPLTFNNDIIDLRFLGNAVYGEPDEKVGELLANYSVEGDDVNPEELGSYLEGDILVPRPDDLWKNASPKQSRRWPNATVPFRIEGNFDAWEMSVFEASTAEFHRRTCIQFVPYTDEDDFLSITNSATGCWSSVGRIGGEQKMNLQSSCFFKLGTVMHEMMHTLGFMHQHSTANRDDYVDIQFRNIRPKHEKNFFKNPKSVTFDVPYDFSSVLHYSAKAFSINREPTIVPRDPENTKLLGQRIGLSILDVEKLNRMYNCSYQTKGEIPEAKPGSGLYAPSSNPDENSFLNHLLNLWGFSEYAELPNEGEAKPKETLMKALSRNK